MNKDLDHGPEGGESSALESNPQILEAPCCAQDQGLAGPPGADGHCPGFLELVFGVLFEPIKTMKKVAARPPLGLAALIVAAISLLGAVMGLLIFSRALEQGFNSAATGQILFGLRSLVPLGVVLGIIFGCLKWFCYSAILHLTSELLGGRGSARGVFAAAGLAGLPSIFMIPVQFSSYWFGAGSLAATVLVGLAGLAVLVWSVILLVIGLKEVHGLSTGRSVLVIFTPTLVLIVMIFLIVLALVAVAAQLPAQINLPGYF